MKETERRMRMGNGRSPREIDVTIDPRERGLKRVTESSLSTLPTAVCFCLLSPSLSRLCHSHWEHSSSPSAPRTQTSSVSYLSWGSLEPDWASKKKNIIVQTVGPSEQLGSCCRRWSKREGGGNFMSVTTLGEEEVPNVTIMVALWPLLWESPLLFTLLCCCSSQLPIVSTFLTSYFTPSYMAR